MTDQKLITVFASKSEVSESGSRFKEITEEEFRKTIEIGDIFRGGVYFDWSASNGFGQLDFFYDREKQRFYVNNECMSRAVVRQLLYALVDKIVDEGEMDCERG